MANCWRGEAGMFDMLTAETMGKGILVESHPGSTVAGHMQHQVIFPVGRMSTLNVYKVQMLIS